MVQQYEFNSENPYSIGLVLKINQAGCGLAYILFEEGLVQFAFADTNQLEPLLASECYL